MTDVKRSNRSIHFVIGIGVVLLVALVIIAIAVGSSWSSFWPDMILALITGVAVGAALLFAQTVFERRREIHEAQNSWFTLKIKLSTKVITTMQIQYFSGDLRVVSRWLKPLRELTEDVPLGKWLELLDDPVADDLNTVSSNSYDLEIAAEAIERSMPRFPDDPIADDVVANAVRLIAINGEGLGLGIPEGHAFFERIKGGPLGYLIPEFQRIYGETSEAYDRLVTAFDDELRLGVRWSTH